MQRRLWHVSKQVNTNK